MEISINNIAKVFFNSLKKKIKQNKYPSLAIISIKPNPFQLFFINLLKKWAKKLKIKIKLCKLDEKISFQKLLLLIKELNHNQQIHGIIISFPIPARLMTESLFHYISPSKDIEGHHPKSLFMPPIGLAVLTILKYAFISTKIDQNLFIDMKNDPLIFKKIFHHKKVVLIGRGLTAGRPIGQSLSKAKINYINIHSKTPNPESYYKEADVIISAAGKKVINAQILKPGVVLINVGLNFNGKKIQGDYDISEIKNVASYYTPIKNGIENLNVIYLLKNIIESISSISKNDNHHRANSHRKN